MLRSLFCNRSQRCYSNTCSDRPFPWHLQEKTLAISWSKSAPPLPTCRATVGTKGKNDEEFKRLKRLNYRLELERQMEDQKRLRQQQNQEFAGPIAETIERGRFTGRPSSSSSSAFFTLWL